MLEKQGVLLSVGANNFEAYKLHDILHSFSHDENLEVRKTISFSLHEIAKILGKNGAVYIRASLTKLLSDEELGVIKVIFKNLKETLEYLFRDENQKKVYINMEYVFFVYSLT